MYDEKTKSNLLNIAADLKRTADRLIDLCKEEDDDEKEEKPNKDSAFLAAAVKSKMDKYK